MVSIIVATVALPAVAARDPSPRRGMRRTLLSMLAFVALYVAYVTIVHVGWNAPKQLTP